MYDALLSGDTTDKEDEGLDTGILELIQCWSGVDQTILGVDSVVYNRVNLFQARR